MNHRVCQGSPVRPVPRALAPTLSPRSSPGCSQSLLGRHTLLPRQPVTSSKQYISPILGEIKFCLYSKSSNWASLGMQFFMAWGGRLGF